MLNYMLLSWVRYSRNLKLSIGEMVHVVFHELILKAVERVEEVRHYSFSREVESIDWLPMAA